MARTRKRDAREKSGEVAALPALSSFSHVPCLDDLRIDDEQRRAFAAFCATCENAEQMQLGVVVRLDRGFPLVVIATEVVRAEHAVTFVRKGSKRDSELLPAVGDCVALRLSPGHDMGIIEAVLPRRTSLERWRGRSRGERQVLAANIDVVLVVQPLGSPRDLLDRVARSLVLAHDCHTLPVVVLTKADRCDKHELEQELTRVRSVVGDGGRVVVTSAETGEGLPEVLACVPRGTCALILGESGAGKSTLLNALLGQEALETGEVRTRDDRGRHTTVARRMVALPGAGVIVDAPGLRSLPLVGHDRGLARAFPDVAEATLSCRFRDCAHEKEPGCGVRRAVEQGVFSQDRADAYLSILASMRRGAHSLDPDITL